jgi:hypothetical protein
MSQGLRRRFKRLPGVYPESPGFFAGRIFIGFAGESIIYQKTIKTS